MKMTLFFVSIFHALLCAISILSMSDNTFMSDGIGLSKKSIGFLGCGKISSAVVRGYAGFNIIFEHVLQFFCIRRIAFVNFASTSNIPKHDVIVLEVRPHPTHICRLTCGTTSFRCCIRKAPIENIYFTQE